MGWMTRNWAQHELR